LLERKAMLLLRLIIVKICRHRIKQFTSKDPSRRANSLALFFVPLLLGGHYGEAEDIASEAVAKVCRVLGRESIGAIGAYLNKAVYQVAIDRLEKRDNEISLELLVERGLDTEFGSPASVVVLWEEMNEVDVAMRRLSPRMAQSLRLRYLNDLDFEQIALEQKCPVGTVKSDVRRGIKRLRKEILNSRNSYSAA
jgi:RNA polymerase sigma factor (sigma-70 family)